MKLDYYKKIIEKYRELNKRNCIDELSLIFPDVSRITLESIIFQEYQRKTKRSYYYHAAPYNIARYYERFFALGLENGWKDYNLLKIADEVDMSPALFAKLILEHHYKECKKENSEQVKQANMQIKVSEMLKNTTLIDDAHLAAEVRMCVLSDENYGPISDSIRSFVGQEYENKLKDELADKGFSFLDEKQLREKGYDKTPDIKLDIPIAVEGQVVNWIESKASFGDEERHKEYLRDQYWSYCNRFGPGMVIYWSGYIEELNINKEQGILISQSFPGQITLMDPSVLMKKSYSY